MVSTHPYLLHHRSSFLYPLINHLASDKQSVRIREYFAHPDYNPRIDIKVYDISIVKLVRPLIFGENVGPACLPEPYYYPYPDSWAYVSGWGLMNFFYEPVEEKKKEPITLQYAPVRIVPNKQCYTLNAANIPNKLKPTMLCAGKEYRPGDWMHGSCEGDSGKIVYTLLFYKIGP